MDTDPDPAIFDSDLQNINKKFFVFYFLKVHLHNFLKIKDIKKSQNCRNQCFFLFFLDLEGSGSGRPKNIWIQRIRIRNTVYPNYHVLPCADIKKKYG
jgi:hypothetical protein